ncbi:MAG: helix-turn-helix domain-containing protein [Planctomycetota bacterium]
MSSRNRTQGDLTGPNATGRYDSRTMDGIGSRIRQERKRLRMTQQELATACDMSRQNVVEIERGRVPRNLELFAEVLGVSAEYLEHGDVTPAGGTPIQDPESVLSSALRAIRAVKSIRPALQEAATLVAETLDLLADAGIDVPPDHIERLRRLKQAIDALDVEP